MIAGQAFRLIATCAGNPVHGASCARGRMFVVEWRALGGMGTDAVQDPHPVSGPVVVDPGFLVAVQVDQIAPAFQIVCGRRRIAVVPVLGALR